MLCETVSWKYISFYRMNDLTKRYFVCWVSLRCSFQQVSFCGEPWKFASVVHSESNHQGFSMHEILNCHWDMSFMRHTHDFNTLSDPHFIVTFMSSQAVTPDCPAIFSDLVSRAISQKKKAEYSPTIKKFALTLHFHSNAAYTYVRRIWPRLFPAPSTLIAGYTKAVVGDAGFTEEAFDVLKRKAAQYPLIGTL